MANILHRLTHRHNLKITTFTNCIKTTVSDWDGQILVHPEDINENGTSKLLQNNKYDICVRHSIYDQKNIDKYLKPDVKLIATIRHPFARFKSHFHFFGVITRLGLRDNEDPFDHFLRNDDKMKIAFYNNTAKEFGFDLTLAQHNGTYITEYLDYLETQFSHMVLTDFYDESLILLKRKFCWDMKSIIYMSLMVKNTSKTKDNIRKTHYKQSVQQKNYLDHILYGHFLKIHRRQITNEGMSFQEEIQIFRRINEQVKVFCRDWCHNSSDSMNPNHSIRIKSTKYNKDFIVDSSDCFLMTIQIPDFEPRLYFEQYQTLCEKNYKYLENRNVPLFQFCTRFKDFFHKEFPYYEEKTCKRDKDVNFQEHWQCEK